MLRHKNINTNHDFVPLFASVWLKKINVKNPHVTIWIFGEKILIDIPGIQFMVNLPLIKAKDDKPQQMFPLVDVLM